MNTIEYAGNHAKSRKGKSPGPHTRRNQSKVNHARQGSEAETAVECGRAWVEAYGETGRRLKGTGNGEVLKVGKCWLCGKPYAYIAADVRRKTPGGELCEPHKILVHFARWMDMDD